MNNINLTLYTNYYNEFFDLVVKYNTAKIETVDYVHRCRELRNTFIDLECDEDILIDIECLIFESTDKQDLYFSHLQNKSLKIVLMGVIKKRQINLKGVKYEQAILL